MAKIQIVREVPLSRGEAWRRLTDWPRHGDQVPLTRVRTTESGIIARTGLGNLAFDDPMEIVFWEPPSFCRLEKRGRVVTGWAELRLTAKGELTRVEWIEDIRMVGVPSFATGFSARRIFAKVLDSLLADPGTPPGTAT